MTTRTSIEELSSRQADAWNRHDARAVSNFYTADATVVDPAYPEPLAGKAAIEKDAADFFVAFPDLKVNRVKVISEGDSVVAEVTASGTHRGPLQFPSGLIPATNKRMEFRIAVSQDLDASGNVRQERRYFDVAGVLTQLGLMQ